QLILVVFERIVGTASDNDTRSLVRHLLDRVKSCQENLLVQRHIERGRIIPECIRVHNERVEKTCGWFLIVILKHLLADTALLRSHLQQFLIIKRNVIKGRQFLTDLSSSASVLSANCDNGIHNITPFMSPGLFRKCS